MAVCIAVIGKNNAPIFFKCNGTEDEKAESANRVSLFRVAGQPLSKLNYSFIAFSALDIVEERVQSGGHHPLVKSAGLGGQGGDAPTVATRELYLGALRSHEDHKVYGYMTNTKIKFIIIVEETSIPLRENDIRMMFRKLHAAYCDLMLDPFYHPGSEIKSKKFEGVVESIMQTQTR